MLHARDLHARDLFARDLGEHTPPVSDAFIEPNPDETAWTLGVGGAIVTPWVVVGAGVTLATTLMNNGVSVPFGDSAVLDASVWPGGGETATFSPLANWISAIGGTLTLIVTDAQAATLTAGVYRMQLGITPVGGVRVIGYDGWLTVRPAVGTTAAPLAWCDESDVLLYATSVLSLQAVKAANDASGYLLHRVQATQKTSRKIVKRYNPRLGFVRTRHNTPDPILGELDYVEAVQVFPSKDDVTAALGVVGGVVLEEQLREIIARWAIALILRRSATSGNAAVYRQEAMEQEAMADDIFHCYQAQMVSASPIGGNTRFLLDMDCIILPAGTSA